MIIILFIMCRLHQGYDLGIVNLFLSSFKEFQVLNLIGRGGFACVYRARSVKTGEEVAIKMIDKKLMKSSNMIGRVRREVEIHSRY